MLKHFDKLHSPLKTVLEHPTLQHQLRRFKSNGWNGYQIETLWDLWNDTAFVSPREAKALDDVEPFDEWEEFALFATHYFISNAFTNARSGFDMKTEESLSSQVRLSANYASGPRSLGRRRYGASVALECSIAHHGGHGSRGRLSDVEMYVQSDVFPCEMDRHACGSNVVLPEVVCHTLTRISPTESLLVGGRSSPARALSACYWRQGSIWKRVQDLPRGRYRHAATTVDIPGQQAGGVLIYGGKAGTGHVLSDWHLWCSDIGWRELESVGEDPPARFGAAVCGRGSSGYLTGGIGTSGDIQADLWLWELIDEDGMKVRCTDVSHKLSFMEARTRNAFGRFGAKMLQGDNSIYLVGGVSRAYLTKELDILVMDQNLHVHGSSLDGEVPRPLLVGHSAEILRQGGKETIVIIGGGAVCFSFGTYFNEGSWTISARDSEPPAPWCLYQETNAEKVTSAREISSEDTAVADPAGSSLSAARCELKTASEFDSILNQGRPVILEKLNLGSCVELWAGDYLKKKIGTERTVSEPHGC